MESHHVKNYQMMSYFLMSHLNHFLKNYLNPKKNFPMSSRLILNYFPMKSCLKMNHCLSCLNYCFLKSCLILKMNLRLMNYLNCCHHSVLLLLPLRQLLQFLLQSLLCLRLCLRHFPP